MDPEVTAAMREVERAEAAAKKYFNMLWQLADRLKGQPTEDDTPLPLERAVCHPILGGRLRADPAGDVPGPAFTVPSLRRAILKGDLKCVNHGRLQFVTPAQLRAWINRKPDALSVPVAPSTPPPLSPAAQTLYEKRQGNASVSLAMAALDSVKPSAPAVKKRRK